MPLNYNYILAWNSSLYIQPIHAAHILHVFINIMPLQDTYNVCTASTKQSATVVNLFFLRGNGYMW